VILRLGHAELMVRNLAEARAFYVDVLGFDEAGSDERHLYLRGSEDLEKHTLTLTASDGPGLGHLAFRASDPDDLDALEKAHVRLGLATRRVPPGAEPGQGEALRVQDPLGYPVEFYHDFELVDYYDPDGMPRLPMRRTHTQRGIPPTFINHVNIRVSDMPAAKHYWVDVLGFSISEQVEEEDGSLRACWTRRKPMTHDVALLKATETGFHHLAYLVEDVIRAADLIVDSGWRQLIDFGPGRHGATNAFYLYVRDPDGNRLEIYANDYWKDLDLPRCGGQRSRWITTA
jgi:catechol 2,3-dioxygenase